MLAQEEARRLGHNFVGTEQVSPHRAPVAGRFPLDRVPPTGSLLRSASSFRQRCLGWSGAVPE